MQYNDRFLKQNFTKFLVPSMLSVLGGTINVLVDDIMLAGKLGSEAIATLNICMPIYLIICTVGSLIGGGAAQITAAALGREDSEKALYHYRLGMTLLAGLSLIITLVGLITLNPLCQLLCKNFEYTGWVKDYLFWIFVGTLPKAMLYFPFNYLPIEGKNRQCSIVMLLMLLGNVTFDFLFIYVWEGGMSGAGFASTLASLISCVAGFVFLNTKKGMFKGFRPVRIEAKACENIVINGSPYALNNLCSSLRLIVINYYMQFAGGADAVATFAAINSLNEFCLCIISGVPNTGASLLGVYYTEKNNRGIKMMLRIEYMCAVVLMALAGAMIVFQTPYWGKIFGGCVVDFYVTVPFALSLILAVVNNIMIVFFSRTGHVKIADLITVCRLVIFVILGLLIFGAGERTRWLFLPAAEFFTCVIWLLTAIAVHAGNKNTSKILLLDRKLDEQGNVLDFSVAADDEHICEASEQITQFCDEQDMGISLTMKVSMAIEEILMVMKESCYEGKPEESFDIRVFALDQDIGMRIRCMGKHYNPLEALDDSTDEKILGVRIINELAELVSYRSVLGANTLLLMFEKERKQGENGV